MRHSYLFIVVFMLISIFPDRAASQNIAVKSNVLYDLTGTLNLGGEIRCDDRHSFQLGINYNPWSFGENKKMKQVLIQPEYRFWLDETFIGSFVGVQAHYAQYNFGNSTPFRTVKDNRYQGNLIGCGVTYGHQWLLSAFWSVEASVSVGYAHLKYDKYGPAKGDALIEKSRTNYFGPTQIGISMIYFIQ